MLNFDFTAFFYNTHLLGLIFLIALLSGLLAAGLWIWLEDLRYYLDNARHWPLLFVSLFTFSAGSFAFIRASWYLWNPEPDFIAFNDQSGLYIGVLVFGILVMLIGGTFGWFSGSRVVGDVRDLWRGATW